MAKDVSRKSYPVLGGLAWGKESQWGRCILNKPTLGGENLKGSLSRLMNELVLMSICVFSCPPQAGLIETNGELKVFIDQNLSPSKGESCCLCVLCEGRLPLLA